MSVWKEKRQRQRHKCNNEQGQKYWNDNPLLEIKWVLSKIFLAYYFHISVCLACFTFLWRIIYFRCFCFFFFCRVRRLRPFANVRITGWNPTANRKTFSRKQIKLSFYFYSSSIFIFDKSCALSFSRASYVSFSLVLGLRYFSNILDSCFYACSCILGIVSHSHL